MKNPYPFLSDDELAEIAENVTQSKKDGVRAESLVPYAKEIFRNLNLNTDDPSISLRECISMAYADFVEEILRRFVNDVTELDAFRNRETEKTVIQSAWNPDCCPACGYELSELLGDGYYSHPTFLERCPKCLQELRWKDEKLGKEAK